MLPISIRPLPWLVVVVMSFLALPARAQFNGGGGATTPPPPPPVPYYGGGYGGYGAYGGGNFISTPREGYLNGVANVTTANAQYQLTMQQAKLQRQDAIRSVLQTRRATIEEEQWERAQQPTAEQVRRQDMAYNLDRARHNPPSSEIWSATALNDLLRAIQDGHSHGLVGPQVPLSPEVVQHLNVTGGTTYAGVGLLKDDGKLTWPAVLRKSMFKETRTPVDQLFYKAVEQAHKGQVDADLLDNIDSALKDLKIAVDMHINDLTPTQYVQASRYGRELKEAYQVLQQDDVAKFFKPAWTPRGSTVGELVGQMTQQGLRFAAATSGDETYYTSFYRSMVDYDIGIAQRAQGLAKR